MTGETKIASCVRYPEEFFAFVPIIVDIVAGYALHPSLPEEVFDEVRFGHLL
jgi:hypothetical protein